jgi:hypothetical protein
VAVVGEKAVVMVDLPLVVEQLLQIVFDKRETFKKKINLQSMCEDKPIVIIQFFFSFVKQIDIAKRKESHKTKQKMKVKERYFFIAKFDTCYLYCLLKRIKINNQ